MSDDAFDTSELIDDFVDDARVHLGLLDDALLRFEASVEAGRTDRSVFASILGALHTLKGNAGMMGFGGIQHAVHELETVIKKITSEGIAVTRAGVDALFAIAALLHGAVAGLSAQRHETETFARLEGLLATVIAGGDAAPDAPAPERQGNAAQGNAAQGNAAQVESVAAEPAVAEPVGPAGLGGETQTIKIDFKRLDRLLNLVGELVMYRTSLNQVQTDLVHRGADLVAGRELSDVSQLIGKTVTELQEAIMEARLLPMRTVLHPFPRLVRDIARKQGKKVTLHLRGAETELDKTVIDKIGEPLLHLVRNAVDHGIELPDQRRGEGKTETGNLTISAAQESNSIIITVEDDGRGLDAKKILEKARRIGLVDHDRKMAEQEIFELIFSPGFSTADQVTEISGRGVGMDVVRAAIAGLGGVIELDTIAHLGTKFTVKLPLTLAIITALLVRVGEESYAVPITHVLESVRYDAAAVHEVNDRQVLRLRDRILPLADLRALFQLPERDAGDQAYVVVLGRGERRVGLIVDGLLGQMEIVIKGIDEVLGATPYIAGASVLGDGRVILIVDVARLLAGADMVVT